MTTALALTTGIQILMILLPTLTLVIATCATAARFHARKLKTLSYGADDWLALVALVFAYGLFITNCISVVYGGLGLPIKALALRPQNLMTFFQTSVALGTMWGCAVLAIQFSILFFYIRMFGIARWFRLLCYSVMSLCGVWWFAILGSTFGLCNPPSKLWNPMKPGQCGNVSKLCGGTGLAHVFLDLIILCLPLPVIWRLQTTRSNKIIFTFVFTIGIFATICSVLRIGCLVTLLKVDENDITGSGWLSILFEILEVTFGILCVCIPTFPPVWKQVSHSRFGSFAKYLFRSSQRSSKHGEDDRTTTWSGGSSNPRSYEFKRLDDSRTHIAAVESAEGLSMPGRGGVP